MSRLHVVFDLDDTLYPERQFAVSGFKAAAGWAEATFGVRGLDVEMIGMLDSGMLGKIFPTVLGRHVPAHTADHLKQFQGAYRACDPELTLFPDALAALDHFGGLGPIGLITDGTLATQQKKVGALGIGPRFAKIVYTDALDDNRAYFKPHPKPFEVMELALGGAGDRFVYIGDNPVKDFAAPNGRGWSTVQIKRDVGGIHDATRTIPGGDAQHQIASLAELPALLGRL